MVGTLTLGAHKQLHRHATTIESGALVLTGINAIMHVFKWCSNL